MRATAVINRPRTGREVTPHSREGNQPRSSRSRRPRMPHLIEKFRRFRQRRRSPAHSPHPAPRAKRRVWPWIVASVVVAMGAYFWLTTAKLLREPIRLKFGPTDPAFTAAMGPLVGAEFMGGNRIEMLVNGD